MKRLWVLVLTAWWSSGCHRGAHPSLACIDQVELAPRPGGLSPEDAIVVTERGPGRLGLWKPDHAGLSLRVDGVPVPVALEAFTDDAAIPQTVRLTPQRPLALGAHVVLVALHPNVEVNPFSALPESARSWTVEARPRLAAPSWSGPLKIELAHTSFWARLSEPPEHGGTLQLPIVGELGRLHVRLRLTDPEGNSHEVVVPAQRTLGIGQPGCTGTFRLREGARYTLAAWVGGASGPDVPAPSTLTFEAN